MEKFKIQKICIMVLLLAVAGILYSCREVKDSDVVFLNDSAADEPDSTLDEPVENINEKKQDNFISANETGDETEDEKASGNQTFDADTESENTTDDGQNKLYVYICGAVVKPDVYIVDEGTRLIEAVKLAGGLKKDAAGDYVNLAAPVQDGQRVYIPTKEEVKDIKLEELADSTFVNHEDFLHSLAKKDQGNNDFKVNINTASEEELMTLPGIGKAKAASIIAYREEHGGFKSIEEIMNISGIKNSVFNQISDKITVK